MHHTTRWQSPTGITVPGVIVDAAGGLTVMSVHACRIGTDDSLHVWTIQLQWKRPSPVIRSQPWYSVCMVTHPGTIVRAGGTNERATICSLRSTTR